MYKKLFRIQKKKKLPNDVNNMYKDKYLKIQKNRFIDNI